jgi:hypothetical protein
MTPMTREHGDDKFCHPIAGIAFINISQDRIMTVFVTPFAHASTPMMIGSVA